MNATSTIATTELMTAEEFYDWAHLPENIDTPYELEDGRVVEMSRPGEIHGYLCWWIGFLLGGYVVPRGGYLLSNDTGIVVKRRPDSVRGPDVMVFLKPKQYDHLSDRYCDQPPELIIEIYSPNDRPGKLNKRIKQYQAKGVPLVWVVYPDNRSVDVYRPGESTESLEEIDTLDGGTALPDFKLPLAELFKMPGTPT